MSAVGEPGRDDDGDGDSKRANGLDRIEGDMRSARAGSIGLAPEDVNIDVNGRSDRARSIGLRFRWF